MKVTILPSKAVGTVTAPPSKSMAHRALICGALSTESTIRNIAYSQDVEATLRCLQAMGATVTRQADSVTLGGLNPFTITPNTVLDCGESGSTLRFLLPLCLLASSPVILKGSKRLLERPLGVYEDICRQQKLTFFRTDDGITVAGQLSAGTYRVPGDISSQFITGLMLALSLLKEDSVIEVVEPFESRSYVTMTEALQKAFGIDVCLDGIRLCIKGKGQYCSREYTIEGDCSNAAFLDGFNLLNGSVKVLSLSPETAQGDRVYQDFYRQIQAGGNQFDLSDCPDLGPVMFALTAASGGAKFIGTARLRIKESDRVTAMVTELAKFGISATAEENTVEIHNAVLRAPTEVLCGHNDHRIVMALSLLCSKVGGVIDGAEAVAKSYPDYFDVIRSLGIEVRVNDIS